MRYGSTPKRRLSRNLNALAPWRWFFDLHPVWMAVVCAAISPGVMWLNDILLVHGRFVPFNQQWVSAQFDIALSIAIATLAGGLRNTRMGLFPYWLASRLLHRTIAVAAFIVGLLHVWQERASVSSWERRLGPNSLYHNLLLYPFLGYALTLLLLVAVATLWRQPLGYGFVLRYFAAFLLIGSWVIAGQYDGKHQFAPGGIPKAYIANQPDPWCGGLLTRPLCGPPKR